MEFRPENDYTRQRYGKIAQMYRLLELVYFGDVTGRSRNCLLGKIPENVTSALIVACGNGDFGAKFAKINRPRRLSLNDTSGRMLQIAQDQIRKSMPGVNLTVHECDILKLDSSEKYDFIAVNYFLSMFTSSQRRPLIKKIVELLSPQGTLLVADFNRPSNRLLLPFFHVNWWLNVILFWICTNTRPNLLGDLESDLTNGGLRIVEKRGFLGGLFAALLLRPSRSHDH